MHCLSNKAQHRSGFTLVLFVFFMMMSIALAALVIDVGFVRLTKRQMQSMTDAAAVELQRQVDATSLTQPFEMQQAGVTVDFEEDGTVVAGNFRASTKWGSNSVGHWQPALQQSQGNLSDDIVVGDYQSVSSNNREQDDYTRNDFVHNPNGNDVLVRLRRTGESLDAGGSAGPPVPFFFGRGLIMGGSTDMWNRIERGTILRQTSIAKQSPARFAGSYVAVLDSSNNLIASEVGLINVRINRLQWQGTTSLNSTQFTIFDSADVSATSIGDAAPISSGSVITSTIYLNSPYPNNSGYVLITESIGISGHTETVVGFGYVQVDHATNTLTRLQRRGYHNTSGVIRTNLSTLNATQLEHLINASRDVFLNYHGISAPALVRSE